MEPIKKDFIVEASQQISFTVFVKNIDQWWPREIHIGQCPLKESILEPKPGGRWYSIHEDGAEINIGHILTWDPYGRLVLAWQVNGNFAYDPSLISEIEIHFIEMAPAQTRVLFEHRDLEKLQGGQKVIEEMDEGWSYILSRFSQLAQNTYTQTPL